MRSQLQHPRKNLVNQSEQPYLTIGPIVAYSKNDLTVSLQPTRIGPGKVSIEATFRNDSIGSTFEKVNMQAAVPKSQKLRLEPISNPTIAVGEESIQSLRITATKGVCSHSLLKPI